MAAYLIADTHLTDPAQYEEYKVRAKAAAEKYGGQYLARGGQLSIKESDLWSPTRIVIIRFESYAQANQFYDSADYQSVLPYSQRAAKRTVLIVEGV